MARPARGKELLSQAQKELSEARSMNELRIRQAVVFPLANGLSIEETARAIGRSPRWVTQSRNAYIREGGLVQKVTPPKRNRAHMSYEEEAAFLAPFFDVARSGGVLVVNEIHHELVRHLGHKVCLATTYNLLHRHGWRKLAPNKRNIAADVQAQEQWKKNCVKSSSRSKKTGNTPEP